MATRRYLLGFALTCIAVIAVTAGIALLVDPYAYWNTPAIAGVNDNRPYAGKHLVDVKGRQYARLRPSTLVIGNSRVDVGVDPESDAWPPGAEPIYNFGLPGWGEHTLAEVVRDAAQVNRPQRVLMGVEFLDFPIEHEEWLRPTTVPPGRVTVGAARARVALRTLVSIDALTDSLGALAVQRGPYAGGITAAGHNLAGEYRGYVDAEGHHALFARQETENARNFAALPKRITWDDRRRPPYIDALDDLARDLKSDGIEAAYFTYPYHARVLVQMRRAGLWPAFEAWIRELAALSARTGTPVYVFTVVGDMTTEAVPAAGDRQTEMRWYWEGGHFKPALGDLLIRAMTTNDDLPFGQRLTPANADAYLDELDAALDAFARDMRDA